MADTLSSVATAESPIGPRILNALCRELGLPLPLQVAELPGGRNNRVFQLASAERTLLAKLYFHHSSDPRDRLRHEFGFLEYLWAGGVRCVAQPVWADYDAHMGVYEFVRGRTLTLQEIAAGHVDQACAFYRAINERKGDAPARRLPDASEACFSIAEHVGQVVRRIERLNGIAVDGDIDRAAQVFVDSKLVPLWDDIAAGVTSRFKTAGAFERRLRLASRALSPSDFGFHNSLLTDSGKVCFLDFEYAGWDDPAKLVCDFANQPHMLLPDALSARFRATVVATDDEPDLLEERIDWLTPVYQTKWSCIALNDFLPFGRYRASFLDRQADEDERKERQLAKARQMLSRASTALQALG